MRVYVLITAEVGKSPSIQQSLQGIDGISQVNCTAGTYDLVAVVERKTPKEAGEIVLNLIQKTDGVLSHVTLLQIG